jgi:glucose/arabinose dehydrogenase
VAWTACALVLAGCSAEPRAEPQRNDRGPDTVIASPSDSASPTSTPGATPPAKLRPRVAGTITTGLDVPWGIAFLPDDSALVSERDTGRILRITPGGAVRPVGVVPDVFPTSEGGLLGLAVSPSYAKDRLVYAYLTTESDNRVVRMRYDGELGPPEPVVTGIPSSEIHDGGRLAFGPDGMLYVATGDAGDEDRAPDPESLGGKVLRVTPTGRPAPGNPTPGSPVWSLGHRNVEGLAFDAQGRLWACEFGYQTWDELNRIRPGGNYGWPRAEGDADIAGLIDPVVQWRPADASPSGLAYAGRSMWLGALQGERLWGVQVRGGRVVGKPQAYFLGDYGRLRTVVAAPDGSLWVTTSNTDGRGDPASGDDRILRVVLR